MSRSTKWPWSYAIALLISLFLLTSGNAFAAKIKTMNKDSLKFNDRTNCTPAAYVTSETIRVVGHLSFPEVYCNIGTFRVNGGPWIQRTNKFKSGDTLQLRIQLPSVEWVYIENPKGASRKMEVRVGGRINKSVKVLNWKATTRALYKVEVRKMSGTLIGGKSLAHTKDVEPNQMVTSPKFKVSGKFVIGQVWVSCRDAKGKGTEGVRVIGGRWQKRKAQAQNQMIGLFTPGDTLQFRIRAPGPGKIREVRVQIENKRYIWYVSTHSKAFDN
jgi:hypothetical protein